MGEELVEVKNKIIETSEEITPVVQFKEWVVDSDLPHIPFRQLVNKALQDVNLASVISKIEKGTEYVVKVPLEFKKAYDEGKVFVAQNSKDSRPLVNLSARNGLTVGFSLGAHPIFPALSCIEILHFSKYLARRCLKIKYGDVSKWS